MFVAKLLAPKQPDQGIREWVFKVYFATVLRFEKV